MSKAKRCQDILAIRLGGNIATVEFQCERLVVNAAGRNVGHVHHRKTHGVGRDKAITTWRRWP